ncbi:MAG: 5'(3')-deoxyribonucleotidase [Chitinophagaceae bacterium]
MERKRVLIDMDQVMADITTHFIEWYKEATGEQIPYEQLLGRPEVEAFPKPELIRKFLYTPGFFRTAKVMPGSQEVVAALNKHYEVFIVSAATEFPQSLAEKIEWLQEHFPFIGWQQVVLCGSKKPVTGDYMIDDHLKNLDPFEGEKILFTATHNSHIQGYTRVNNWEEVRELLLNDKESRQEAIANVA